MRRGVRGDGGDGARPEEPISDGLLVWLDASKIWVGFRVVPAFVGSPGSRASAVSSVDGTSWIESGISLCLASHWIHRITVSVMTLSDSLCSTIDSCQSLKKRLNDAYDFLTSLAVSADSSSGLDVFAVGGKIDDTRSTLLGECDGVGMSLLSVGAEPLEIPDDLAEELSCEAVGSRGEAAAGVPWLALTGVLVGCALVPALSSGRRVFPSGRRVLLSDRTRFGGCGRAESSFRFSPIDDIMSSR